MKLSHILSLVVGSAAAILASISPAHALSFTFSLPNSSGSESGTVTGTLVLPDTVGTTSASASSLTITSAPGTLSPFNGLQLIGNSNFDVLVNSFTYDSTTVTGTDLVAISKNPLPILNNNYLAFRFRLGDSSYPLNFFAASSSNNFQSVASGVPLVSPSVINGNPALVTFVPESATVPFDIPGGATIPALGGLLALGAMRKARKSLASKTCIASPVTATVS